MNKNLIDCLAHRNNNLDIIRFLAALAVIYSHSFDITHHSTSEPLYALTHQLLSVGHLSVAVFFIISGFLITQSYHRAKSLEQYFIARILRIYPGLIFVVLCTVFLIGPFWTTYSITGYFSNIETIKYLINILSLKIYFRLGGVMENAAYPNFAVNGSLWTLPYELVCYLIVPAMALILKKRFKQALPLLVIIAIFMAFQQAVPFFVNSFCFLCGALFYLYRNKVVLNPIVLAVSVTVLLLNFIYNREFISFNIIMAVSLSYIIMFLGYYKAGWFNNFTKNGDYSYGLYIWAFPLQQIIFHIWPTSIILNFLLGVPLTLIFAYLSWNLIEKRALKYKNYQPTNLRFQRFFPANKTRY